ncbi:hypothetical protein HS1genome_2397 [Sulfodiicoccus acidiphilus]|uniref:ATPase n=1 Tax=Sulfodiicoccus acidiphilus TaxID=1670455 RepID=A0A348B756_9CREN|nr:V-type ATPase subunit [Sulfodiicoccus acidiphilus]BBD74008.1 hypothetical protein HS1genome_2397 [Sulfodiicoccus acidiphilus]GGT87199.1 hypothetical protein GCM10007116_01570 [Sulfodiicoccus acidiphilus]
MSVNTYLTSIARLLKSKTLSRSLMDELLGSGSWKESANILKERGILPEVGQNLEDTEAIVKRHFTSLGSELRNFTLSSNIGKRIADLYYYRLTLNDLKYLVSSVYSKVKVERRMILSGDQNLFSAAESSPNSIDELSTLLRGQIYGEALEYAAKSGARDLSALNSSLDLFFIIRLSSTINEMRGDWKAKADQLTCGYRDYYALSMAATQRVAVSTEIYCKVSPEVAKDLAAASSQQEGIEIVKRTEYGKGIQTTTLAAALAFVEHEAKIQARKAAKAVFMGDPFTPLSVMAALELISLDQEDIIKLFNAQALGFPSNKIKELLSFEFI